MSPHDLPDGTDVAAADPLSIDRLNLGAGSLRRRNPPQAFELAQGALSLAERLAYSHGQLQALLTLAHGALDAADYAVAEQRARQMQALALASGASWARAAAGVVLGIVYTRHSDFEAALEAHAASRALYRELGDRSGEAEALMYTGGVYLDLTRHAEAHGYLTQALDIFAEEANLPGQMQAHLMLGITAGALGELAAAFQHNLRALELSEQEGDLLTQLRVLNNLVNSYSVSAESDKALACSLRALELTEVLENPQMRAALLVNVATTYLNLGELDRALGYADEALELAGERGYLRDQAEAFQTLGRLYLSKNEPERAERCFRGALETARAASDRHAEAVALTSLAELAQRRGQYGAARELFSEGIATARLTENALAEIGARLGLGKLLAAQGEEERARGELQRAVRLAHRHDTKRQLCDACLALSESFERDGQLREALDAYKRYAEVWRQFSHERIAERTSTLMGQLELERAEKRAELEHFKNTELAQANAALQRTLDENTTLLAKLREQALRLERQTREDALTGLANRRHLEEMLALEFGRATQQGTPLGVALVDIDDFKRVNDTLSHQLGDAVLRTVAEIFRGFVREDDLVARYGGEEFALVFPQTALPGALAVCERIREAVESYPWKQLHPDLVVTLSIGVAAELGVKDHEKLLALADDNLYRAKHAGKNRVLA